MERAEPKAEKPRRLQQDQSQVAAITRWPRPAWSCYNHVVVAERQAVAQADAEAVQGEAARAAATASGAKRFLDVNSHQEQIVEEGRVHRPATAISP